MLVVAVFMYTHTHFLLCLLLLLTRNNSMKITSGMRSVLQFSSPAAVVSVIVGGAVNSKHSYFIHNDHSVLSSFSAAYTNTQFDMFCRLAIVVALCWPLCLIQPTTNIILCGCSMQMMWHKFYSGLFWHLSNSSHWNSTATFEDFFGFKIMAF